MDNWQMRTPRNLTPYLVAELQARESARNRDYAAAKAQAAAAAALALESETNPAGGT